MFKIPTYEELEKKESERNKDTKDYTSRIFQKRKKDQDSAETVEELKSSSSVAVEIESPTKKLNTVEEKNDPPKETPVNTEADEDDDDELLNNFITENKDIIESSSQGTSASTKSQQSTDFLVPAAPAPIRFDPKVPVQRAPQILQSNSTSTTGSGGGGSLIVNSKQRGNLVLKHIRCVQWKFCDQVIPDYQINRQVCGFFLSMKYHLLNPTYIHKRIRELGRAYTVRVLLALVDVKEPRHCIKELENIAIISNLSMVLCWSNEEVARYLETFKAYEFKSAEAIMEKATTTAPGQTTINFNQSEANFVNSITDFLCQIKSINKTDASTLRQTYGSIKQLSQSTKEELNLCPGLGPLKVNRLHEIFKIPFLLTKK